MPENEVTLFKNLVTDNHEWYMSSFQILSRTPQLSEDIYKKLVAHAQNEDYDVSNLHKTVHVDGVGASSSETGESSEDRAGLWWLKSLVGK